MVLQLEPVPTATEVFEAGFRISARPIVPSIHSPAQSTTRSTTLSLKSACRSLKMMSAMQGNGVDLAGRDWAQALLPYRRPNVTRGVIELAITVVPFVALWAAMLIASRNGEVLLSFAMAPFAAGLLVRLFMIQHDCGHGALLPSKAANDWIGRAIGVLTMTPYDLWRRSHAIHHATSGNLDRRGIGDIDTLTVREYIACGWLDRLRYRLYRHPLVMFGLGPLYLFVIENRLPFGFMRKGAMPWLSTMTTNAGIFIAAGLLIWVAGFAPFLIVQLPIVMLGATAGVWLFYVQHQFEGTIWEPTANWSQPETALHGSSLYQLPPPLDWFSGNIGVHHVHHLSSGIPFYRLPEVLRDHPALGNVGRVGLWQSLGCVRLALWDEEGRRMVSFRDAWASRRIGHSAADSV
jgi:omega-6 fatty acid desaturase (delta-12 desaturase)